MGVVLSRYKAIENEYTIQWQQNAPLATGRTVLSRAARITASTLSASLQEPPRQRSRVSTAWLMTGKPTAPRLALCRLI